MTRYASLAKRGLVGLAVWAFPQVSLAAIVTLRPGDTEMSVRIQQIHQMGLWVCVVVGIFVICAMFYTMFAHRRSRTHVRAAFSENILVEFIWTLIPILILVAMVIPATSTLREIDCNEISETISFGYVDHDIQHPPGYRDENTQDYRAGIRSG